MGYTRREFIKGTGVVALSLCMTQLKIKGTGASAVQEGYLYRDWEDLYRQQWVWDKVVKGTHCVNCSTQYACNWNIYVKDGIVVREEQAANYQQTNPEVPDFNPRGCQKGASFSHRMYAPSRIKYPLKRIGERGEGKWQRISWEEALTEIADAVIEGLITKGPDSIIFAAGTHNPSGVQGVGHYRNAALLDATRLTRAAEIGDHFPGVATTMGKVGIQGSADDSFYSDLILIWGGNPFYTQIPNSHFFLEARYNGAKLVTITPDYNPSSIHCDYWIPVNIGTDAALGLSIAQVIVKEGLYNEEFMKEQTDLPLLVREDTRRFLREEDVKEQGEGDLFYAYDPASQTIKEMPKGSLSLPGIDPALEGEYEVVTLQGKVKVRPVFAFLKSILEDYTPEKASRITGIHPDVIRRLAKDIAKAKAVSIIGQFNFAKYYHGNLMERAQLLVLALCGHFGKKGSGYRSYCSFYPDGIGSAVAAPSRPSLPEAVQELGKRMKPIVEKLKEQGLTNEMMIYEMGRGAVARKAFTSGTLFFHLHGGIKELSEGRSRKWDPYLKREAEEYIEEALERGWQFVNPPPGKDPFIFISEGGNILRRVRGYPKLIERLLPKLRLLLTIDWRMSNTGLYSDLILPCAWGYERDDIWPSMSAPDIHINSRAVAPLGESKSEWEIHCLLARKIQERAKEKGILTFKDNAGKERRLDRIYEDLTFERAYTEKDIEKFIPDIIKVSSNLPGVTWEGLKEKGHARVSALGRVSGSISNAADIKPQETVTPLTWHVEKKIPWPTLTRRIQFYIDHEWYLELGEELPVHKDSIKAGGDYPLQLTGGHTRWSIHSSWRDDSYMLRLQRGFPVMYMSPVDAEARGIKDGDEVEVKNDIDSFRIHAKVSAAVRPGQVISYHAWEPFQHKGGKSHSSLMPGPINPIEAAGDYFQLRPTLAFSEPGCKDRDTRVDVVRIV
jgi:DMSO reductase family type II enzyme molybdopterin subunit